MSIIVKGMKMPDSCAVCRFAGKGGYHMERVVCMFTGENEDAEKVDRLPECPLVALPDKHGRLVDADAIVNAMNDMKVGGEVFVTAVEYVKLIMNDADTIVEAEDSK